MDVENVIVNGVELSQPAELCDVFRNYFGSTFRKDEGNDPKLNYSASSRMQHFTISAEDVHRQLINLNPRKSEAADEIHPRILTSLARYLAASPVDDPRLLTQAITAFDFNSLTKRAKRKLL